MENERRAVKIYFFTRRHPVLLCQTHPADQGDRNGNGSLGMHAYEEFLSALFTKQVEVD